jgi:hypothetical protein
MLWTRHIRQVQSEVRTRTRPAAGLRKGAAARAAAAAPPRAARASPGHMVACGHACIYGAVSATM